MTRFWLGGPWYAVWCDLPEGGGEFVLVVEMTHMGRAVAQRPCPRAPTDDGEARQWATELLEEVVKKWREGT